MGKEHLFAWQHVFAPGGNVNGLVALALVVILAPLALAALRRLPPAPAAAAAAKTPG